MKYLLLMFSLVTMYNMFDAQDGAARHALFAALVDFCVDASIATNIVSQVAF